MLRKVGNGTMGANSSVGELRGESCRKVPHCMVWEWWKAKLNFSVFTAFTSIQSQHKTIAMKSFLSLYPQHCTLPHYSPDISPTLAFAPIVPLPTFVTIILSINCYNFQTNPGDTPGNVPS